MAAHPVTRLLDGEAYKRWSSFASREERIVAYADKRAAQRLESMDARFASWRQRYPRVSIARRPGRRLGGRRRSRPSGRRADRLEADVCRAAGIEPSEVGQLRWTAAALQGCARGGRDMTTSPLLYVWGDDDLGLGRDRRPIRRGAGHGGRDAARALGPARRDGRRDGAARRAPRADRDAGHVRRRDARGRGQRRGADADDGRPRRDARRRGPARAGQRAGHRRRDEVGREGALAEAPVRRDQGGRRLGQELPVTEGRRPRRLDRARGARARTCNSAPGAAKEIAQRVGGFVQENDADAPVPDAQRVDGARQARAVSRHGADLGRGRPGARPGGAAGLDLGVRRCGRRTRDRAGPGAPRAPPGHDRGAGPRRGPPSTGARAARAGRSAGQRREPRDRGPGDGHQQRVPGRHARDSGPRPGPPRSSPTRSTGSSSSMRWSRGRPGRRRTRHSDGWRSRSG